MIKHVVFGSVLIVSTCVQAESFDPFAQIDPAAKKVPEMSNLTTSIDFIFQGTYTPEKDLRADNDFYESSSTIDAILKYELDDANLFKFRAMSNYTELKYGNVKSYEDNSLMLEYFYRSSFANKSQYLTLGRKNLGWSSGFQWRPADVIDNGFTTKNFDSMDPTRYRGIDLLQYEVIGESYDFSALLTNHNEDFFNGKQSAFKLSFKGDLDGALILAKNGNYSDKVGITLDASLPWATTFALEAVHVEVDANYLWSPQYFGQTLESLSARNRYQDIYLGLTKFIDDKQRVNLEYFHNGRGFAHGRLQNQIDDSVKHYLSLGHADFNINQSIFKNEYLGVNYLYSSFTGFYESYDVQYKPSVLINVDDGSYIFSFSLKKAIGDNSELLLKTNFYRENKGTDLGEISSGLGVNLSYLLHIF